MKTHPAFPLVYSPRGAPMGRPNALPYTPPIGRAYAKRATPTDGDYDQGGAYWGDLAGRPLYAVWGYDQNGDLFTLYYRAPNAQVARDLANARIGRRMEAAKAARNPYNPEPTT
jgi:hypothetical protein